MALPANSSRKSARVPPIEAQVADGLPSAAPPDLLDVLLSKVSEPTVIVDPMGNVTKMNALAEALTGHSACDVIGHPLMRLLIQTESAGTPVAKLQYSTTVALDAKGGSLGTVVVFGGSSRQDSASSAQPRITGSTDDADALFDERERARITLDCIGDAVITTDFRGRVTYLNTVAETMTGWSQRDAAGQALDEVFQLINAQTESLAANLSVRAIIENKKIVVAEDCVVAHRDGYRISVEASAAPVSGRHGDVVGSVIIAHDVTAARDLASKFARQAMHDSLTDLPNRILLNDRLAQAIRRSQRTGRSGAVLYLDLDRFKLVNDTHGHDVGDRLLCAVARRLLTCVRASDTVCRLGGDEFAILLSEITNSDDVTFCAEKVLRSISAPFRIGSLKVSVGTSIGIASFPEDAKDPRMILKRADLAMYQVKSSGRNGIRRYDGAAPTTAIARTPS